jgi:hypothetical protein
MVTPTRDIESYLKSGADWTSVSMSVIFPNWSSQDWDDASGRIQSALTEAGFSPEGPLPRLMSGKSMVAPEKRRIAAETILFNRYNEDGLFSLPHQKDPSVPRPSWFRDCMLVPGPHSIGQKLITVTRDRAKKARGKRKEAAKRTEQRQTVNRQNSSDAATERTFSTQATPDRTAEETITPEEETLLINGTADRECETPQAIPKPRELKDLEIHIGTIFELDTSLLKMRRTYRNPSSWIDDSAPERFNFDKVCQSLGITGGWEKELYFFPDVTKGPHNILDEEELDGAVQLLRKQISENATESGISLFVAADVSHVQALPVEKRGK